MLTQDHNLPPLKREPCPRLPLLRRVDDAERRSKDDLTPTGCGCAWLRGLALSRRLTFQKRKRKKESDRA